MRAGVTIVDPASDGDRRRRGDRPGHDDRAVHARSAARTRIGAGVRRAHSYLRRLRARGRRRASARSPTCGPARCCARAPRRGRSWRSRTPTSARARRCRTSPTSATRTSASAPNLGAGTITANYDGRAKHRTTIGSGVRGGVDTALVAPVTVGDDAYTAAGSVITEDVPPGALGVARASARRTSRATPSADVGKSSATRGVSAATLQMRVGRASAAGSTLPGEMSSAIDTRTQSLARRACRSTTTSG